MRKRNIYKWLEKDWSTGTMINNKSNFIRMAGIRNLMNIFNNYVSFFLLPLAVTC